MKISSQITFGVIITILLLVMAFILPCTFFIVYDETHEIVFYILLSVNIMSSFIFIGLLIICAFITYSCYKSLKSDDNNT